AECGGAAAKLLAAGVDADAAVVAQLRASLASFVQAAVPGETILRQALPTAGADAMRIAAMYTRCRSWRPAPRPDQSPRPARRMRRVLEKRQAAWTPEPPSSC